MSVCTIRSWSVQYHSSILSQTSSWKASHRTVLPAYASYLSVPAHDAARCFGRRTPVLPSLSGRWSVPLCGFLHTPSFSFPPHCCPHHGPGSWRQRNCCQRLPGSECSKGSCNKENKVFPGWSVSIQSCVCVCVCVCTRLKELAYFFMHVLLLLSRIRMCLAPMAKRTPSPFRVAA